MSLVLGDARHIPLADETVQCCVTSPPYWGLRDYGLATWEGGNPECDHKGPPKASDASGLNHGRGRANYENEATVPVVVCPKCGAIRHDAGIGLEPTLDEYIENMRAVGRELWRVLWDDGTLWLNLGDCYASDNKGSGGPSEKQTSNRGSRYTSGRLNHGLKQKDLVGIPWRVAFALQADGWYLRSDIIWAKPNPMPESVTDRPTKSHEYLFLLTKQPRYYYDNVSVMEPSINAGKVVTNNAGKNSEMGKFGQTRGGFLKEGGVVVATGRNRRTVWTIPTQPYRGAHFATFPEKLVEPCILAGTSPKACGVCGAPWERVTENLGPDKPNPHSRRVPGGQERQHGLSQVQMGSHWSKETTGWRPTCDHNDDTGRCLVLDPFCGSGTVGKVALEHGRRFVGMDLKPEYLELARERMRTTVGMRL